MCYPMTTIGKNALGSRQGNKNSRGLFDPRVCVNCWIPRKQRLFVQVVVRQTNKHCKYIQALLPNVSVVLWVFYDVVPKSLSVRSSIQLWFFEECNRPTSLSIFITAAATRKPCAVSFRVCVLQFYLKKAQYQLVQ